MNEILAILLGIPIGIICSLISWWILYRVIQPKLKFSKFISKIPSEIKSGSDYRIKLENSGRRPIIDVELIAHLSVLGIFKQSESRKTVWKKIPLKLSVKDIIEIQPQRNGGLHKIIKLKINDTNGLANKIFGKEINNKYELNKLTLEELFEITDNVKIQFTALCYDEYSGSRKMFRSKVYSKLDILPFEFEEKTMMPLVPKKKIKEKIASA